MINRNRGQYSKAGHAKRVKDKLKETENQRNKINAIMSLLRYSYFEFFILISSIVFAIISLIISIASIFYGWESDISFFSREAISNTLWIIAVSFPSINSLVVRKEAKKFKEDSNEMRRLWRKVVRDVFFSIFLMLCSIILSGFSQKYPIIYIASLYVLVYMLTFSVVVIYACHYPIVIFNRYFLLITDVLKIMIWIFIAWLIFFVFFYKYLSGFLIVLVSFVAVVVFSLYRHWSVNEKDFYIENIIVKLADLNKLKLAISRFLQTSKNITRAASDVKREIEVGNYDYLQAFVKEVQRKEGNSKFLNSFKYVIVSVLVFIFLSIAEGLTQDAFNDEIKEFICIPHCVRKSANRA